MRKKVERKYYSKDKKFYFLTVGKDMVGIFNDVGDVLDRIIFRDLDMCKSIFNDELYLFRWFKNKGFILGYKIANNDIDIKNALVFSLEKLVGINYVNLWEGLDLK